MSDRLLMYKLSRHYGWSRWRSLRHALLGPPYYLEPQLKPVKFLGWTVGWREEWPEKKVVREVVCKSPKDVESVVQAVENASRLGYKDHEMN